MPGTLLPHEILMELTEVAGRIVDEVLASEHADALAADGAAAALYKCSSRGYSDKSGICQWISHNCLQ